MADDLVAYGRVTRRAQRDIDAFQPASFTRCSKPLFAIISPPLNPRAHGLARAGLRCRSRGAALGGFGPPT